MYSLNDFNNNNNNNNAFLNPNGLPINYLGYIEYATSNPTNQDFLNTSQNEKTWLNSSLTEKNFLNSSLNLPIEQRYISLNEMVAKITEEEKNFLANSTNNLNILNQSQILQRQDSKKRDDYSFQNNQIRSYNNEIKQPTNQQSNIIKHQTKINKPQIDYMFNQQQVNTNMLLMNTYNKQIAEAQYQQHKLDEMKTQIVNTPTSLTTMPSINNTSNKNTMIAQFNDIRLQKLVYPPSVSHQLATLSPDQQSFLLQQQNELVAALSATEHQYAQQYQQNRVYSNNYYQQQNDNSNNFVPKNLYLNGRKNQFTQQFIPNQFSLLNQPVQISANFEQMNIPFQLPYSYDLTQNQQQQQQKLFENSTDPNMLQLNEKLKYLSIKPPYRQHRRTVPANELHVNIEECLYQLKSLENERKKIETELSYLNMNKQTNKPLMNPAVVQLPRLSTNPSRVDRLIIDILKEHTKTCLILSRIDNLSNILFFKNVQAILNKWLNCIQNVQARRNDEIINNTNRQRLTLNQSVRLQDEKDVTLLANSVSLLAKATRRTRTSLWCAWQISFFNQQPGFHTDELNSNDTLTDQNKFNDFSKKIFQIKTDISEISI